jgi:hypothetical protein
MAFFHVYKSPMFRCSFRRVSAFIARGLISVLTGARKLIAVFTEHRRFIAMVTEVDEKLRRCKSHLLRRGRRMDNRMAKIMLNYRTNGRRRLGMPLKRLLDVAETGLSRSNS